MNKSADSTVLMLYRVNEEQCEINIWSNLAIANIKHFALVDFRNIWRVATSYSSFHDVLPNQRILEVITKTK